MVVYKCACEIVLTLSKIIKMWSKTSCLVAFYMIVICVGLLFNRIQSIDEFCNNGNLFDLKTNMCRKVIFNNETTKEFIQCELCFDDAETNITVCKTSPMKKHSKKISLSKIIKLVPKGTKHLLIVIDNFWNGNLPLEMEPLDLRSIDRLHDLISLGLQQRYMDYLEPFPLLFDESSFKSFHFLTKLSIQLSIKDQSLKDIVKPLQSLNGLDLSFTRGLSLINLTDTLSAVKGKGIKYLCLKTFQLIGGDGYSSTLDLSELKIRINDTLSQLTEIDLSDNAFARITPGISLLAPNLEKLDISGNNLLDSHNVPIIMESMFHPHLVKFNGSNQGYNGEEGIDRNMFKSRSGREHKFSLNVEESKHKLKWGFDDHRVQSNVLQRVVFPITFNSVGVSCLNKVAKGNVSTLLHNNTKFCMVAQCIFPIQFHGIPCQVFPKFSDIFDSSCYLDMRLPIGKYIEEFSFSHVHWGASQTTGVPAKGTMCLNTNSLRKLIFNGNADWVKPGKIESTFNSMVNVKGFEKLEVFEVSNNGLNANISFINSAVQRLNSLTHINFAGNQFQMNQDFKFCNSMPKLEVINFMSNKLTELPKMMIRNCTYLKQLILAANNISNAALSCLDLNGTNNIDFIDLSSNMMNILDMDVINKLENIRGTTKNPITLDLSQNPLSCGCDEHAIRFLKWLKNTDKIKFLNKSTYTCSGPEGLKFIREVDVDSLREKCFPTNLVLIMTAFWPTVVLLIIIIITVTICHYRWRIHYHMFQCKQNIRQCFRGSEVQGQIWKYDAFVSYCANDRFWVHDVLMKELENKYGFRLCIHYRDFPVGGCIFETVSEHMLKSRHIIVVLSDVSMQRNMCQFEINEAQKQVVDQHKSLLLIKLGALEKPISNAKVAYLLDRHTYLEWDDEEKAHPLFWAKLVGHLYDDLEGSCCCCCAFGTSAIGYSEIVDTQADMNET